LTNNYDPEHVMAMMERRT